MIMTPKAPQQPPNGGGTSRDANATGFSTDLKVKGPDGTSSSAWGDQLKSYTAYATPLKGAPSIFESRVSSSAWVDPLRKECPNPGKVNPSIFEDADEEQEDHFKRVISQATKPSSTFENRVSSGSWVGALKREISQPENPTPSIFEDAEEDEVRIPSSDSAAFKKYSSGDSTTSAAFKKFPSGDSTTSGLELLAVATMQSNEESGMEAARTLSNGSTITFGAVSLEADGAQSGAGRFPPAVAKERATTVEFLKKLGLLESATKSTNSLIKERLGVASSDEPVASSEVPTESRRKRSTPPMNTKTVGSQPLKKRLNSMALEEDQVQEAVVKQWDILSGRGGKSNHHPGNKRFRQVVDEMKNKYRTTNVKTDKTALSKAIVDYVESYGGRFLTKKNAKDGHYRVMTKAESRKKTSQALRETKELKWKLNNEPAS